MKGLHCDRKPVVKQLLRTFPQMAKLSGSRDDSCNHFHAPAFIVLMRVQFSVVVVVVVDSQGYLFGTNCLE